MNKLETKHVHFLRNRTTRCDITHQTQSFVSYSQFVLLMGWLSPMIIVFKIFSANWGDWSQVGRAGS